MWKKLENFDNYYISSDGKIYSKITKKFLKFNKDKYGYLVIRLRNNKKVFNLFCHRLVAKHFIKNENNYEQVNHIDSNKLNNHYLNLEWCSNIQNQRHKRKNINTSSKCLYVHFNKSKNKWIAQPTINGKRIYKTFKSEQEAIRFLNEASDPLVINEINN